MTEPTAGSATLLEKYLSIALFLFPLMVVTVKQAGAVIFTLLALPAIYLFFTKYIRQGFSREEKLVGYASLFFLLAAFLVTVFAGFDSAAWKKFDDFLNILLVLPLYFLFKNNLYTSRSVWWGLALGVIIAGIVALYERSVGIIYPGDPMRAKAATHPILFADITLVMTFIWLAYALYRIKFVKGCSERYLVLPVFILGILAVVLSGSRGAWVVVPVLVVVLLWVYRDLYSKRSLKVVAAILAGILVVAYLVPGSELKRRVDFTIDNATAYLSDNSKFSSIGTRFAMWEASWKIFRDNPVAGVGWGNYKTAAQNLVDKKEVSKFAANWNHPHNEFLSAMANGGLLMLFALVVLFWVPLYLFRRVLVMDDHQASAYAGAGLVLVISYIGFGLSESILERALPTMTFSLYLALLLALSARRKKEISLQSEKRNTRLSVTVIAYNEVDRLGDCLASVAGWADEIIVFDNGSTDGTIELAKQYTDNVFVTDWPGFGKQKQRALDKAQYDWVLSIDADERLTPELRAEIDRVLDAGPDEVAFRIPWAVTIYNKRLDFGRSGRAPLRLFRREGSRFSEASVHEKVLLPKGKVGLIQERLLHYTHRNLNHAVRKFNDYAWLWGTERFEKGKRVTFVAPVFHGLWTFFVIYFLRLGMLDGFRGLIMAVHLSLYTFNKYSVLWTLEQAEKKKAG